MNHRSMSVWATVLATCILLGCRGDSAPAESERSEQSPQPSVSEQPLVTPPDAAPPVAESAAKPADPPAPGDAPLPNDKADGQEPVFPFVHLNLKDRYIDLPGKVCLEEGILELVATVRLAKEHESPFTVKARPQHIHAALLMLGLKPGKPGRWEYRDDQPVPIDPTGDKVKISVLIEADGQQVEKPISHFIRHRVDGTPLPGDEFVFAGSRITQDRDGTAQYAADGSGDVIALVSFGDELLAWPTAASGDNAGLVWVAAKGAVPALDTAVTIRLRAAAN